jgi:ribosomal protein S18 acetylase RimI-like enzyme
VAGWKGVSVTRDESLKHAGYRFEQALPTVSDYNRLRVVVGWSEQSPEAVAEGLPRSLYSLCVYRDQELVGYGRIVGDGGVYFYIQDIIVLPEHQGQGLGHEIMSGVMAYLAERAYPGSFIGLMAAKGVTGFYERYGFAERPPGRPGMFLIWGQ